MINKMRENESENDSNHNDASKIKSPTSNRKIFFLRFPNDTKSLNPT